MTDWTPPKAEGLSGDAYLSEQIEAFADGPSDARQPGVYVLKCSQPAEFETVARRWRDTYDVDAPEWLEAAFESQGVLYVGGAKDVYARITEHIESPNRSASICHIFPIHSVWDVTFYDDPDRAFERESGRALELGNAYPSLFVWQN